MTKHLFAVFIDVEHGIEKAIAYAFTDKPLPNNWGELILFMLNAAIELKIFPRFVRLSHLRLLKPNDLKDWSLDAYGGAKDNSVFVYWNSASRIKSSPMELQNLAAVWVNPTTGKYRHHYRGCCGAEEEELQIPPQYKVCPICLQKRNLQMETIAPVLSPFIQ